MHLYILKERHEDISFSIMLSAVGFRFTGHCLALKCGKLITRMGLEHTTSGTADPARYIISVPRNLTVATRNNFSHNILC